MQFAFYVKYVNLQFKRDEKSIVTFAFGFAFRGIAVDATNFSLGVAGLA